MRNRMHGSCLSSSLVALTLVCLSGCAGGPIRLAQHLVPGGQSADSIDESGPQPANSLTPGGVDAIYRAQSPTSDPVYSDPAAVGDPFAMTPTPWINQSVAAQPAPTFVPVPNPGTIYSPYNPGGTGGFDPFSGGSSFGWMQSPVSPPFWNAYVAGGVKGGNERVLVDGELMVPLLQDGRSLMFADIRGQWDDVDNAEGNFGLAYRTMLDPFWIFGIYGYYDIKETQNGSEFQQGSVGAELLSVAWEARVNGYIPEGGTQRVSQLSEAQLIGTSVVVQEGREAAYWGVDAEVGALLAEWFGGQSELRGYIGGFYFDTDATGFENITGPRGRLEYRSYDLAWLGMESRLTLGVEVQWDEVRDTQVAGIARLQIPLGPSTLRPLSRLERRMLNPIVRDVDIVTNTSLGAPEVAIDVLTGKRLDNVQVTTNANDLNTKLAAVPAMNGPGNYSVVIADGSQGAFSSAAPVVMQTNQQLLGGAAQISVAGEKSGAITTFRAPGVRPTIHGTNPAQDVIQMVSGSTVREVDVRGGDDGISGANLSNFFIVNNTIAQAGGEGIDLTGTTNGRIMGNTAFANSSDGIRVNQFTGGEISGNTSTGNVGAFSDGYQFTTGITGGTITNNVASNNGDDGFFATAMSGGTFSNNQATGNTDDGIDIDTISGGTISGNTMSGNLDNGFESTTFSGGVLTRNTSNNNLSAPSDGYDIATVSGGTISQNTANGNADDGFDFGTVSGGTITGNTAIGNKNSGIEFTTFSGGTVSNNAANSNFDGFFLTNSIGGTFTGNRASSNRDDGYDFDDVAATGVATGNTATFNMSDGFEFDDVLAGGVFSNNISNNNVLKGYNADMNLGTAVNNTGAGNGTGGNTFP